MEDKKARLEKIKSDVKSTNYDERLAEKTLKARNLEEKREELTAEIRTLTMMADVRAKLSAKMSDLKTKTTDVKNTYVLSDDFFLFLFFKKKPVGSSQIIQSFANWSVRMHVLKLWNRNWIHCFCMSWIIT